MALIRRADAGVAARDAVPLDLGDLQRQGEEIVARARQRAAEILAEAEATRRRLVESARADGIQSGRAEGMAAGLEEGRAKGQAEARAAHAESLQRTEGAWLRALEQFEAARESLLVSAKTDVLRLALVIAGRVTRRAVEADPARAADLAAAALEVVTRPGRLTALVHPDDVAAVEHAMPALRARLASARHAELSADLTLSRGSVVLRSERGEIDARIETQVRRIAEALLPGSGEEAARAAEPDKPQAPRAPAAADGGADGGGAGGEP